jgi:hypothetical protein
MTPIIGREQSLRYKIFKLKFNLQLLLLLRFGEYDVTIDRKKLTINLTFQNS